MSAQSQTSQDPGSISIDILITTDKPLGNEYTNEVVWPAAERTIAEFNISRGYIGRTELEKADRPCQYKLSVEVDEGLNTVEQRWNAANAFAGHVRDILKGLGYTVTKLVASYTVTTDFEDSELEPEPEKAEI